MNTFLFAQHRDQYIMSAFREICLFLFSIDVRVFAPIELTTE